MYISEKIVNSPFVSFCKPLNNVVAKRKRLSNECAVDDFANLLLFSSLLLLNLLTICVSFGNNNNKAAFQTVEGTEMLRRLPKESPITLDKFETGSEIDHVDTFVDRLDRIDEKLGRATFYSVLFPSILHIIVAIVAADWVHDAIINGNDKYK